MQRERLVKFSVGDRGATVILVLYELGAQNNRRCGP